MSALARLTEMDRTTLTRNLKPLADAGFVDIAAGTDARSRVVSATARGREARSGARELWRRAQDEVNQALGAEQVAALHALLDRSLGRFNDRGRGRAARERRP
jgi:DNA-binding MarR family transcriptional regulator